MENPSSGSGVHLKHRISKREYKVVLSKTYVGAILLMHMYQGKREVGFNCRSASFDLASPELRVPDFEVRSVHESTTSPINPPLWLLPRLPHEEHTIALTLILASFISIRFKLSIEQAKLSKQSITEGAAIRIVLLTLQGCTATHTCHQLPLFACHRSRDDNNDATTTLRPQLRSSPESHLFVGNPHGSPAEVPVQPQTMCAWSQAGLEKPFIHFADRATALPDSELLRLLGFEWGEVLGREGSVSPMCGCTLLLGSPHKNSGLRRCSTRQPTVYSYTASHRSPCIRVDSPTQFHHHRHDHYHHDSQF